MTVPVLVGFGALFGVLLLGAWGLVLYNGLVAARQECRRAWSNIDVLLKQRHDELPRLVEVCRGYMAYERATLEAVIHARNQFARARTVPALAHASGAISGAVRHLFAVAEQYPDLKANESFLRLQTRITELENQIADRRELYNAAATEWNTRLEQVPDTFVARAARMEKRELWRAEEEERAAPGVSFGSAVRSPRS
jgi:LemA protein